MIINDSPLPETEVRMMQSLTLAYMGDCVYDMLVREALIKTARHRNGWLHHEAKKYVSAHGQSGYTDTILEMLTPDEEAIYRRGRNSHASPSRHVDPTEYHKATGLEALFGYLYLTGNTNRIYQLFTVVEKDINERNTNKDLAE